MVCKDCKSPSPVEAFIPVDALHMQCPMCLYVFFTDISTRKTHQIGLESTVPS